MRVKLKINHRFKFKNGKDSEYKIHQHPPILQFP